MVPEGFGEGFLHLRHDPRGEALRLPELRLVVVHGEVPYVSVHWDGPVLVQGKKRYAGGHLRPHPAEGRQFLPGLVQPGVVPQALQPRRAAARLVSQLRHCLRHEPGPVSEALRPEVRLGGPGELVQGRERVEGLAAVADLEPVAVGAQGVNHGLDAGDVVVGGEDEGEEALKRVLPQQAAPREETLQRGEALVPRRPVRAQRPEVLPQGEIAAQGRLRGAGPPRPRPGARGSEHPEAHVLLPLALLHLEDPPPHDPPEGSRAGTRAPPERLPHRQRVGQAELPPRHPQRAPSRPPAARHAAPPPPPSRPRPPAPRAGGRMIFLAGHWLMKKWGGNFTRSLRGAPRGAR